MTNQPEPKEDPVNLVLKALSISQDDLKNDSKVPKKSTKLKRSTKKNRADAGELYKMVRTELFTRPPCRRLQPWPNPDLEGPYKISRAALKAKMSRRLEYLAKPREDYSFEVQYSSVVPNESSSNKYKNTTISKRLIELSMPKQFFKEEEKIEKKYFKNEKEFECYLQKLKKFAAPRQPPLSPMPLKRNKKQLKILLPYLTELSKPVNRPPNNNEKTFEELYTIKNSVLKHVASNRTQKLATAKSIPEEALMDLNYDPRAKLIIAKKYKATNRINELAKPIFKSNPEIEDGRSDVFRVKPVALKAWCSPRIKELALPIKRN